MRTDAIPATTSAYAAQPATKAPAWHGLVTLDVLFNNLTAGLFLVAALGELTVPDVFATVARAAYPVAFVFLLADLVCLVADLGDPLRFHHMLRVFKPSSPMSFGTWSLTVYALPLTVLTLIDRLPADNAFIYWIHRLAVIAGILPALAVAAYKGVLFSTSSQPGWKNARWLGGYLTNSTVMLGCAELLALSVLTGQDRAVSVLSPTLVLLLLLNLGLLILLAAEVRDVLSASNPGDALVLHGVLAIGVGIIVPLFLILVGGATFLLAAVVCILVGALTVRHAIVRLPHLPGRANEEKPAASAPVHNGPVSRP